MTQVVLLLSCRDRPGIVASVTGWVAGVGGNITDAQQHTDRHDGRFFQRVQFTPPDDVATTELASDFASLAAELGLEHRFCTLPHSPRTAILVSRQLHCLVDVLGRVRLGNLPLDVRFVLSNHGDAAGIAEMFGHDFVHVPVEPDEGGRARQEDEVARLLDPGSLDLVILARYMLVLPGRVVDPWNGRMINIHHSFLPSFIGANPYRQARDRGVKIIGATAHYVTSALDEGPIIAQDVVPVSHRDDVPDMTARGRDLETVVLARAIRAHVEHRILVVGNRTVVFD